MAACYFMGSLSLSSKVDIGLVKGILFGNSILTSVFVAVSVTIATIFTVGLFKNNGLV